MTQNPGCDRAAALLVLAVAASCMTLGALPGDGTPADSQSLAQTGEYPEGLSHETPEISAPETVMAAPEGMTHPAASVPDAIAAVASPSDASASPEAERQDTLTPQVTTESFPPSDTPPAAPQATLRDDTTIVTEVISPAAASSVPPSMPSPPPAPDVLENPPETPASPTNDCTTPDHAVPEITGTPTPSATASLTPTLVADAIPTLLATESPTLDPTWVMAGSSPSPSPTDTPTATACPTPSGLVHRARAFAEHAVIINEVAWAGTFASSSDEWIELFNPGGVAIELDGWILSDGGDIEARLRGAIPAGEYLLLERTDDTTVSDIAADVIYTGSLRNEGEILELLDPEGSVIDRANASGSSWPAGDRALRASMQRLGLEDTWLTFPGCDGAGSDAGGRPIAGTPRHGNVLVCPEMSPTPSDTPAPVPTAFPERSVLFSEIAWAGTRASSSDEWMELFNPGPDAIDLTGWRLSDGGDIHIALSGAILPGGFFLLERTDDMTVSDVPADQIYSGSLSNQGERLELTDPSGAIIHLANRHGGAWPAGEASSYKSMEQKPGSGWGSFTGFFGNGRDANGGRILGTPRRPNSWLFPTPQPTWIPGRIVINEVLMRPHYDWQGKGGIDLNDEFIELYNHGPGDVRLGGWILDDLKDGGSKPMVLPNRLIEAGGYVTFFRSSTKIALNDTGDTVTLRRPDGRMVDRIRYLRVRAYNLSYGRLPDGSDHFAYGLWPSPGKENVLYTPPSFAPGSILISEVAWAGTLASSSDEWIELWNPGGQSIPLAGWVLTDDNDLRAPLHGNLSPGSYFVLERTNDETISDRVADLIYQGALSDGGERLRLLDPCGAEVDAVGASGAWPAGDQESRRSMERLGHLWFTFAGSTGGGLDAAGRPIGGTPGSLDSRSLEAAMSAEGLCPAGKTGPCP
jgi:hypothetical protein